MNVRRLIILGILLLLTIFMAVRCLNGPSESPYSSVAELAADATLVVRGDVGSLRGTEIDNIGDDPTEGPKVAFYDFDVNEVLAGTGGTSTIVIAWPDLSAGETPGFSAIKRGDDLVLFLAKPSTKDAPGIDTETDFYVPIAADYAVFDVSGSQVTARSPNVTTLEPDQKGTPTPRIVNGHLTASYTEFAEVVRRNAS